MFLWEYRWEGAAFWLRTELADRREQVGKSGGQFLVVLKDFFQGLLPFFAGVPRWRSRATCKLRSMKLQAKLVESNHSFSPSALPRNALCSSRTIVLPPRASKVHSTRAIGSFQAIFCPGCQATISASPSQPGPQEMKIFPLGPGVTRDSRGYHLASSLPSVSAFQTSSMGAATSISLSMRRSFFGSSACLGSVMTRSLRFLRSAAEILDPSLVGSDSNPRRDGTAGRPQPSRPRL